MKSIIELTNQEPIILRFEWFTIRPLDGFHLWMEIDGGEGTQIRKDELMGALAKIWERNFL